MNYSTHNLELVVVVFALKIWRYYLYDATCQTFTDQKSFKYIFTSKNLNMRQRRWMKLLKDYNCTIDYHPSRDNAVANTLSRKATRSLGYIKTTYNPLLAALQDMRVKLVVDYSIALLVNFHV